MMIQLPQPERVIGRSVPMALVLAALSLRGMPVGCLAAAQDAGGLALCAPAPCVARTIPVGNMPVALAVDTRTQHAFVHNGDGTVSVLDLSRGTTLRTVVVSKRDADAQGLAVDEQTGRLFVPISYATHDQPLPGTVSAVDAATARVLKTIPVGVGPMGAVVDARARQLLALNYGNTLGNIYATGSVSVLRLR